MSEPIDKIQWRPVTSLNANNYNPNVVMNQELKLLEWSILTIGWVQPVLITPDGTIIDGFHRWMLSKGSEAIQRKYGGLVPCAVLDVPRAMAMAITVRINRAKGNHVAVKMHELVTEMVTDHGMSPADVAREIGATKGEVELLMQENVFKAKNLKEYKYSKAWVPVETTATPQRATA